MSETREWHALVIGVDRYPSWTRQLNGCTADAAAMAAFLSGKLRVPDGNLHRLSSPQQDSDPSTRATAANIRSALTAAVAAAAPGDHVVLFFAGHGTRVEGVTSSGAKERYYAFVPEDVAQTPKGFANLILGREIYTFLRDVERKGATATLIADTCHSGGATRGMDEAASRSAEIETLAAREWAEFTAAHPALQAENARALEPGITVSSFGAYPGGDFVMLTGCLDAETSKENLLPIIGPDGAETTARRGLMTHTLLKELERESADTIRSLRWMDLHDRVRNIVAALAAPLNHGPQTPLLEGRPEKTVFGGQWQPFEPGFTVRQNAAGLTVDGGALHGLEAGAVISIHPPDTRDFHAAGCGIEAVIVAATPATSTAQVSDTSAMVADRSRARLVRPSPAVQTMVVRIHNDAALAPAMRDALSRTASDGGFALVDDVPGDQIPAHVELRRWKGALALVNIDRFGSSSVESPATITADNVVATFAALAKDDVVGTAIGGGLTCWAKYLRLRDRRAVDDTLKPMLDVRLRRAPGEARIDGMETLPVIDPVEGIYRITDADWLWADIRVKKATSLRLDVAWMALSDDGNVIPLWPPQGANNSFAAGETMYVGRDREQALPLSARDDQSVSMWTLRAIACTSPKDAEPLNIWSLAQDSVQEAFAAARAGASGEMRGALREPTSAVAEQPAWFAWDFRVAITAAQKT